MSLLPDRHRQSLFPSRSIHQRIPSDSNHHRLTQSLRSKPYDKPLFAPTRSVPDNRWRHDLFEDDSNLYSPQVRYQLAPTDRIRFGNGGPSPSLRPFGNSTSTPPTAPASNLPAVPSLPSSSSTIKKNLSSPVVAPSTTTTITAKRPPFFSTKPHQPIPIATNSNNQNTGISLLSRIQSCSGDARPKVTPTIDTPHPPQEIKIHQQSQIQNQNLNPNPAKNHQALFDQAMAKYLNGPVILEVANLADGTSADDVKTAFADFGDIQECSTEEGARQLNQPTLKAKMIFTHKSEAEKAVDALNGALADGLTLAVKIIGRPTKKPERADFMSQPTPEIKRSTTTTTISSKPSITSHPTATMKVDNGGQDIDVDMADVEEVPIIPTGRLRSEVVAQCDPRASIQIEPKPAPIYEIEQVDRRRGFLPKKPSAPTPMMMSMMMIPPNMLSRVQPSSNPHHHHHHNFSSKSPVYSTHHSRPNSFFNSHPRHHNHFNHSHSSHHLNSSSHFNRPPTAPAGIVNPQQNHQLPSKSLLARIKP
ncbi:hypothetical protein MJO28_005566 [Puccinia striiformis f. sp. tritici]|uniref:RRM domain-containing protein n=2 Tax=Puccinia striiformis TaxID=27350 RepID=A0A2S4VNR7_9BASI|nr:hypothetical protein MJO28_005566 [Puccinia striiformis f. sp. tritici]POW11129.1 hypothetical protein PSTT_05589 [Puccinia striiformis]